MLELCKNGYGIRMEQEQSPEERDIIPSKTFELLAVIYRHSELKVVYR